MVRASNSFLLCCFTTRNPVERCNYIDGVIVRHYYGNFGQVSSNIQSSDISKAWNVSRRARSAGCKIGRTRAESIKIDKYFGEIIVNYTDSRYRYRVGGFFVARAINKLINGRLAATEENYSVLVNWTMYAGVITRDAFPVYREEEF